MGAGWYACIPFIIIFLLFFIQKKKRNKEIAAKFLQRKEKEKTVRELARRFIGKDCIVNMLEGTVDGVLREVTDGGIVVEKNGKQQAVNLDYVMKIREYPYNKKGKRASLVGE